MPIEKSRIVPFGDEGKMRIPNAQIDCSRLGYFDTMEDECWELIKSYADRLGIEILDEDGEEQIHYDLAKRIQDTILNEFILSGVEFKFGNDGIQNVDEIKSAIRNMDGDDLFNEDIYEFDSIDHVFKYFYDEEVSKSDLVEQLSDNEKVELVSIYLGERILQMDGKFYVNNEGFGNLDVAYYSQEGKMGEIKI